MQDETKQIQQPWDLQVAIQNLKTFAENNKESSAFLVHALDAANNGAIQSQSKNYLRTTLMFLRCTLSAKARKTQLYKCDLIQKKMLESIDCILKHPLSETFKALALPTITLFNDAIKEKRQRKVFLGNIGRRLLKRNGFAFQKDPELIPLPRTASLEYHSDPYTSSEQKAFIATETAPFRLLKQENSDQDSPFGNTIDVRQRDALQMKAISSLRDTAFRHTLQMGKPTPMKTIVETGEHFTTIKQIFEPFPGEIITFLGKFKKSDSNRVSYHRFLLDNNSVQVAATAKQQGFPHPIQHTGFALTHALLAHPHPIEQLPQLSALLDQKQAIAHALLPQGAANEKAKKLLRLKKEAFDSRRDIYLSLHRTLALTIAEASPDGDSAAFRPIIEAFFDMLCSVDSEQSPYSQLSDVYHKINLLFIIQPLEALEEQWVTGNHPGLRSIDSTLRLQGCFNLLMAAWEANYKILKDQYNQATNHVMRVTLAYMLLMGRLLGHAACSLLLQLFSEKMQFTPPSLTPFEKQMQECLYEQLRSFVTELSSAVSLQHINMHEWLKNSINRDIDIFSKSTGQIHPILLELENHYAPQPLLF